MEILVLGIVGVIVLISNSLLYVLVNKKLNKFIERNCGVLTYKQAINLVNLYLEVTRYELRETIKENIAVKLESIRKGGIDAAKTFMFGITNDIIKKNREQVATFELADGQKFNDFLDETNPIHAGIIGKVQSNISTLLDKLAREESSQYDSTIELTIDEGSRLSAQLFKKKLSERYHVK